MKRIDQMNDKTCKEKEGKSRVFGTLALLTGLVSLAIFLLTENMALPMALTDRWTILMSL